MKLTLKTLLTTTLLISPSFAGGDIIPHQNHTPRKPYTFTIPPEKLTREAFYPNDWSREAFDPNYWSHHPAIGIAVAEFFPNVATSGIWSLEMRWGMLSAIRDAFSHDPELHNALQRHSPTYKFNPNRLGKNDIRTPEMIITRMFSELVGAGVMFAQKLVQNADGVLVVDPRFLKKTAVLEEFLGVVKKLDLNAFKGDLEAFKLLEKLSEEDLYQKAISGNVNAQHCIFNKYLRDKNKERILECAERDWESARRTVITYYTEGWDGFIQDPEKLLELAEKGWEEAQDQVAKIYAYGWCGLSHDLAKLLELAEKGGLEAQALVAEGYAEGRYGLPHDLGKLLELAEKGWEGAQDFVARGYAKGKYGLPQNQTELLRVANLGWATALQCLAVGYAEGSCGFAQDSDKLLALAKTGAKWAQDLVARGYAHGAYGFTQSPEKLVQLAYLGWKVVPGTIDAAICNYNDHLLSKLIRGFCQLVNADVKNANAKAEAADNNDSDGSATAPAR